MAQDRTLVLCIDRDDDIGFKAGISSPVVGRDACINVATALGLADPEDSDVNAIFQTIKTYDSLKKKGEDVEVAVLAGNHSLSIDGDRKIGVDLASVVAGTGAKNCILVTDGGEDEFVLPIIQSVIPVSSIQRVIVKQMPNLEGTYYIIKKLLEDPKIAKVVLVPIGLAMLLYAMAYLLGYPQIATVIVVGVIGIYLLFKGYGIDEIFSYSLNAMQTSLRGGRITFVAYIVAIVLVIVGVIMGMFSVLALYPDEGGIFFDLLSFVYGSVFYITGAGMVASAGKIIDVYLNEFLNLGKVIVIPFFILAIGVVAYGASVYMLAIGNPDFPLAVDEAIKVILLATSAGLILASLGVYIQRSIILWTERIKNENPVDLKSQNA